METKVLTQEEIQLLKKIKEKRIQITEQFGMIELRMHELEFQKEYTKTELKNLQQEEAIIGDALQKKYGDGYIDLEKGEFIPN